MAFARHVFRTYALRIVLIPLGIVQASIVARHLGPDGQGVYAAIGTWVAMAAMFGGLGLGTAATAFAAADATRVGALAANARVTGALLGALGIAALWLVGSLWPAALGAVPTSALLFAALALPFSLVALQFQSLLLGRERIGSYNVLDVAERVLLFVGVVLVVFAADGGLVALLGVTVVAAVLRYAIARGLIGAPARRLAPDVALLRSMLGFSGKAYAAVLLSWLVLRSDLALVGALLGPHPTGLYSIAVQLTDLLLLLPATAGNLLFPRIAAGGAESAPFTARICRLTAAFLLVGCAALALVGRPLIALLFGGAFGDAAWPLALLLPGAWCLGVESILANDLAGRDYPASIVATWAVTLALNVALNVLLIPRIGVAGASIASSVAYALALALIAATWLRRFPSLRLVDLLVARPDDLRHVVKRAREFAAGPGEGAAA